MAKNWFVVGLVIILAAGAGYWYGQRAGDKAGFDRAQKEAAKKAAEQANPFNINPLGDVKVNPFK